MCIRDSLQGHTEGVGRPAPLLRQREAGLVVAVAPAGQGLHPQQALHPAGQQDKQAEAGDAGYGSGKGLPYMARHEFGHVAFLNLPLGALGGQLPLGGPVSYTHLW